MSEGQIRLTTNDEGDYFNSNSLKQNYEQYQD